MSPSWKKKQNRSPKLKMLGLLRNQTVTVNLKTDARTLYHSLKN